MSTEPKTYVYTPADVASLTKSLLTAQGNLAQGRQTYLRALIGTTQRELGAPQRKNAMPAKPLKPDQIAEHLGALERVHERFYAAVAAAAAEGLKGPDAAIHLNRRTNFARTAMSAIRNYVRAGKDLTYLVTARVTKDGLRVPRPARPVTPLRAKRRVESRSKTFIASVLELAEVDRPAAVAEIELVMGQLGAELAALGVAPVRNAGRAAKTGAPLTIGGRTFVAVTDTQRLRAQARPS